MPYNQQFHIKNRLAMRKNSTNDGANLAGTVFPSFGKVENKGKKEVKYEFFTTC